MKRFILPFLLFASLANAKELQTTPSDFTSIYASAQDGDTLILSSGIYGNKIPFPANKSITLKASLEVAEKPRITFELNEIEGDGGSLVFDDLIIDREADNFIYSTSTANLKNIVMRNCTIRNIRRCFLRTSNAGGSIESIQFENCIIHNCGNNGYNFVYPKHVVKSVSVKNSTLFNYTGGESFFYANQSAKDNDFSFVFENNTVYKWAKSTDRAICNIGGNYSSESVFIFKNNLIKSPGVSGMLPRLLNASNGGKLMAMNNLIEDYGGYSLTGPDASSIIEDLELNKGILEGVGTIPFQDPVNGNFTILSSSVLATAGVDGGHLGDPRWIKQVTQACKLSVMIIPENAGQISPMEIIVNAGETATVTAIPNFGYSFKEWRDKDGKILSTSPIFSITMNTDLSIIAVFDALTTYTLTVNIEGEGKKWGNIHLSPESNEGRFIAGTIVNASIIQNRVAPFLYWEDQSGELSRQLLMDKDLTISATFSQIPFIVGWNFNNPSEIRSNRLGDFYSDTQNTGLLDFFEYNGNRTNWGGSTRTFGTETYDCARRYTSAANMTSAPRYFQANFSTRGYKNIQVQSKIAIDNLCVNKVQKMQYSTDGVEFIDLISTELNAISTDWIDFDALLPGELDDKEKIYIRWIADAKSPLLGEVSPTETEGFYLAEVYILADRIPVFDEIPPVLLSSIPAANSTTASANGKIVVNFDEQVKAGIGDCLLNGEKLEAVFGITSVSFPYTNLIYGAENNFQIPRGAILDMSGNEFEGVNIRFNTMTRPQALMRKFDAVVATDSSGDFKTIQDAVNAAPDYRTAPWLIFIKSGTYKGSVIVPENKSFIYLIGQDKATTIIHEKLNVQSQPVSGSPWWDNDIAAWPYSVHNPDSPMYKKEGAVVRIDGSDFYAENITFRNDWGVDAQNGPQALAMMTKGDRAAFYNCSMRSFQDTWMTTSTTAYRHYVKDCFIEGAVDYIYGAGDCYIETSTLYNVRGGSVIVAPNHKDGTKWGYVFDQCIIDGNAASNDNRTKLGRPWHGYPMTVFLNTVMKIRIAPEGWTDMGGFPKVFAEYNSMDEKGNLIDLSNRKKTYSGDDEPGVTKECKAVLTAEEAASYTYGNVISGKDNWNPRAVFESLNPVMNAKKENQRLSWNAVDYALCYIIYAEDKVIDFSTSTDYEIPSHIMANDFYIQPVNESGSLGKKTLVSNDIETDLNDSKENGCTVWATDGEINIKDLSPSQKVTLYTIDGKKIFETYARGVSLKILMPRKGAFIVAIGAQTYKIIL